MSISRNPQIWLGSATSTQKLPYSSIKRIDAQPIEGQEEYSILCVQLGEAGTSRYWLYYVSINWARGVGQMSRIGHQLVFNQFVHHCAGPEPNGCGDQDEAAGGCFAAVDNTRLHCDVQHGIKQMYTRSKGT